MRGLKELVTSAFGATANLYSDVLQCSSDANPSQLRKAYHKRALLYHPDKHRGGTDTILQEATLKFQALSAIYQFLSNPSQRAMYDKTSCIPADEDDMGPPNHKPSTARKCNNSDEWEQFFQSVVQEMMNAGGDFDRKEYCGSQEESDDVLHYYRLCKGDQTKMMSCIVQSNEADIKRWWKEIIQPRIARGEIEDFEDSVGQKRAPSSSQNDMKKKRKKLRRKKTHEEQPKAMTQQIQATTSNEQSPAIIHGDLEDTDDDDSDDNDVSNSGKNVQKSKTMSRREKMEFRIAKKRKEKREREIEFAEIMQSKQWTSGSFGKASAAARRARNQHGFSDSFLAGLQDKFSTDGSGKGNKTKKRLKKKRAA